MESQQRRKSAMIPWVRGNCIGKGSFGAVYLASTPPDGALFAVKSVPSTSPAADSFDDEVRLLSSLSSPCVVRYLGDDVSVDPSSGVRYRNLHMEYMPRGTAADLPPGLPESQVRSLTKCVVSALSYIHSRGIVHCDVKGRNVLLGPAPGSAKLADFGSAICGTATATTAATSPRGSPLWMAPEVVRRECQGTASDVWSLGCTVIEMVTGKPAWEDRGLETLTRIGYSEDLPRFPAGLSGLGLDFLDRCLRRDPALRWSCDQLLLHPFLCSAPPAVRQTPTAKPSPRCVLDWFDSDSDSDLETVRSRGPEGNPSGTSESAKQRIGKLARGGGAKWEWGEGWEWVRGQAKSEAYWVSGEGESDGRRGGSGSLGGGVHVGGPSRDLLGWGEVATGTGCRCGSRREQEEEELLLLAVENIMGLALALLLRHCNLWLLLFYWTLVYSINDLKKQRFLTHLFLLLFSLLLLHSKSCVVDSILCTGCHRRIIQVFGGSTFEL